MKQKRASRHRLALLCFYVPFTPILFEREFDVRQSKPFNLIHASGYI